MSYYAAPASSNSYPQGYPQGYPQPYLQPESDNAPTYSDPYSYNYSRHATSFSTAQQAHDRSSPRSRPHRAPSLRHALRQHEQQQEPEVISDMIDSLGDLLPTGEQQGAQQGGQQGAPPPAGPGIFDRPYEQDHLHASDNGTSWYEERSAGTPSTHQPSRESIREPNGLRRMLTSASSRSRTSPMLHPSYQDLDADRVSVRSHTSSAHPSLRRRKSRDNLVVAPSLSSLRPFKRDDRRAQIEAHRSDEPSYSSPPSPEPPAYIPLSAIAAKIPPAPPSTGSLSPYLTPAKRSTKSVSSSRRVSPAVGPIADAIPARLSSLRQTEQRAGADGAAKKSKSKTWSGRKLTPLGKKKKTPLNEATVLEELGDDDETVKRIKELKLQKEARLRHQQYQDDVAEPDMAIFSQTVATVDRPRPVDHAVDRSYNHHYLDINAGLRQAQISPTRHDGALSVLSATSSVSHLKQLSDYDYGEALMTLEPSAFDNPPPPSANRSFSREGIITATPAVRQQRPSIDVGRPSMASDTREFLDQHRASIDVDIDAYLAAPRLNRSVRHPKTSRLISFAEVGDPKGHPVFVCAGMGLTRFVSCFYDELATTLGLRLITPERPGVGRSQRYTDRDTPGPMSWHQDVHAICMALDIDGFSLLAHSAGAVFALATAMVLPHLVKGRIFLLAPWIPPSQFQVTPSPPELHNHTNGSADEVVPAGSLPRSQRLLRVLPVSLLKAANSSFLGINTNSMSSTSNPSSASPSPSSARPKSSARRRSLSLAGRPDSYFSPPPVPDYAPRPSVDDAALIRSANAEAQATAAMPPPASLLLGSSSSRNKRLQRRNRPPSPQSNPPQSPQIVLSATAFPTDTDLMLASTHLSAAQHANDLSASRRDALFDTLLVGRLWDASTRDSNPADDLLVCLERNRPVGFRYTDVRRSLVVLHGSEDRRVELRNVRWLVSRVNAARRRRRDAAQRALDASESLRSASAAAAAAAAAAKAADPLDPRSAWKGGASTTTTTSATGSAGVGLGISTPPPPSSSDMRFRAETYADGPDAEDLLGADAELRVLDGQGHGLMAVAGVMGDVLAEISREHCSGHNNYNKRGRTGTL